MISSKMLIKNKIIDARTAQILGGVFLDMLSEKRIDQTELGNRVSLEQSSISKILNASKKKPELSDYHKIAIGLGLSESEFEKLYIQSDRKRIDEESGGTYGNPDVAFFAEHGITDTEKQKAIIQMARAFSDIPG